MVRRGAEEVYIGWYFWVFSLPIHSPPSQFHPKRKEKTYKKDKNKKKKKKNEQKKPQNEGGAVLTTTTEEVHFSATSSSSAVASWCTTTSSPHKPLSVFFLFHILTPYFIWKSNEKWKKKQQQTHEKIFFSHHFLFVFLSAQLGTEQLASTLHHINILHIHLSTLLAGKKIENKGTRFSRFLQPHFDYMMSFFSIFPTFPFSIASQQLRIKVGKKWVKFS